MTPERWHEITRLFHAALERDASARGKFLDQECASDNALRAEVEEMLEAHLQAGRFGEAPLLTNSDLQGTATVAGSPTATDRESEPPSPGRTRRPPWWMFGVAASYIATFAFVLYLIIWAPAELRGVVVTFADDAMVIGSLASDSQAAKGGLQIGDRVLAIDGRPMRGPRDWTAATGNLEAGRPHRWLVSRGGDRVNLEIVPLRASVQGRLAEGYIQYLSLLLSAFPLGLLVAWKRPADPAARIGAWFLLTASIAFGFPQGWAAPWRELPAVAQLLLWIPQISRFVLEGIFLSFFVVFPRRLFTARWPWFVLWVPVLATLPWRVAAFYGVIQPDQAVVVPAWILQVGFARPSV
jgi:hypothetical protein